VIAIMSDYKRKYEAMAREVGERVRCPTCLDIPSAGPIYTCPRGHCVCSSCYQGDSSRCPVCRARMSGTVSLIAATVIENLEHQCRWADAGCLERLAVGEVETHGKVCGYRTVQCPSYNCREAVALPLLPLHLATCYNHVAAMDDGDPFPCIPEDSITTDWLVSIDEEPARFYPEFDVMTLQWKNKRFCLVNHKSWRDGEGDVGDRITLHETNFHVEMLGTEEECSKYRVAINLENEEKDLALTYQGPPISIDQKDVVGFGLVIKDTMMQELTTVIGKEEGFISVKLSFKEIVPQ